MMKTQNRVSREKMAAANRAIALLPTAANTPSDPFTRAHTHTQKDQTGVSCTYTQIHIHTERRQQTPMRAPLKKIHNGIV